MCVPHWDIQHLTCARLTKIWFASRLLNFQLSHWLIVQPLVCHNGSIQPWVLNKNNSLWNELGWITSIVVWIIHCMRHMFLWANFVWGIFVCGQWLKHGQILVAEWFFLDLIHCTFPLQCALHLVQKDHSYREISCCVRRLSFYINVFYILEPMIKTWSDVGCRRILSDPIPCTLTKKCALHLVR
jgi:hypothetical protein